MYVTSLSPLSSKLLAADNVTVTRKDESVTENINLQVHDDTAAATLGLWGTSSSSPLTRSENNHDPTNPEALQARQGWQAGETILLLQSAACKTGRTVRRLLMIPWPTALTLRRPT